MSKYIATVNVPGNRPERLDDPDVFDSPSDAWKALVDYFDYFAMDITDDEFECACPVDARGSTCRDRVYAQMHEMVRIGAVGWIHGSNATSCVQRPYQSGMVYRVGVDLTSAQ